MRIGIITGEYPPQKGGIASYLWQLVPQLQQLGHQVFLLTHSTCQDNRANVNLENTVRRWDLSTWRRVNKWASDNRLDVVNLHYQTAIYGMSASVHFLPYLLKVCPLVTTFHDLLPPYLFPKAGKIRDWVVRHLAAKSNATIVSNHQDAARLAHLPHLYTVPIASDILRVPQDIAQREATRATLNAAPHEFLVGHFGFLYPNRGVEYLLKAVHKLQIEGIPVKLAMLGGRDSGPTNKAYVETLDALVQELNLSDSVHWTDYQNNETISKTLQACDVIALPFLDGASYRRTSLVAALQNHCAVVSTSLPPDEPTLQHRRQLSLVPPADSQALADELRYLYQHPELRTRYQNACVELADYFSWQHVASRTAQVFTETMHHA